MTVASLPRAPTKASTPPPASRLYWYQLSTSSYSLPSSYKLTCYEFVLFWLDQIGKRMWATKGHQLHKAMLVAMADEAGHHLDDKWDLPKFGRRN